jgi:hypothetical protein
MERWAVGLRAHHDSIRQDIDMEHMALSCERQEILRLQSQPSISPEEVA